MDGENHCDAKLPFGGAAERADPSDNCSKDSVVGVFPSATGQTRALSSNIWFVAHAAWLGIDSPAGRSGRGRQPRTQALCDHRRPIQEKNLAVQNDGRSCRRATAIASGPKLMLWQSHFLSYPMID